MNQAQRNYLIKKIEETSKDQIKMIEQDKPEAPNFSNYLLHKVLSGNFEVQPTEIIRKALLNKAVNTKEGIDWLTGGKNYWSTDEKGTVRFKVEDIFKLDGEYQQLQKDYSDSVNDINQKVRSITIQADTLITRIQLASDKTLEKMINEIDDMGDISLMDTKIKLIGNG